MDPQGTSLLVEVRDIEGRPLLGVDVSLSGKGFVTNQQGRVLFEGLPAGRVVAQIEADGFAPTTAVADLEDGIHGGAVVTLVRQSAPIPFDAGAGATIRHLNVQVEIPPGSLVDAVGNPASGMAEVRIATIDPTSREFLAVPGPLEAIAGLDTEPGELSPLFLAEISLSQGGEPLQLANGATAMIELPLPASLQGAYTVGDIVSSWFYDLEAGSFKEGEPGMISARESDPTELIWTAPVHHFSWWCSHKHWKSRHCYDVTVVDLEGQPVGHQPVTAVGVSYVGQTGPKFTKNGGPKLGHACIEIRTGETATIYLGHASNPTEPPDPPFETVTAPSDILKCNDKNQSCVPVTLVKPISQCKVQGAVRPCEGGPSELGECQTGTQQCGPDLEWGSCTGQVLPASEICDLKDNDCNGTVDDGLICQCFNGDPSSCPGTDDECRTRTCSAVGECAIAYTEKGFPLPPDMQVEGDCYEVQCDGIGNATAEPALDPLDDGNACTKDQCFFGTPVSDLLPDNTSCGDKLYCKSGVCVLAVCDDLFLNGYESDVDCGGPQCSPCNDGRVCADIDPAQEDKNCASGNCSSGVCAPASCANSKRDGCETDVDCGGGLCAQSGQTCPKCAIGAACEQGVRDCESTFCVAGVCSAMP